MEQPSPAVEEQQPKSRGDEVTPIVQFMVREMTTNASSQDAKNILRYNKMAMQDCYVEYQQLPWWAKILGGGEFLRACQQGTTSSKFLAYGAWAWLVRENGDWDHKKDIRETFTPADPLAKEQHYHHYNGFLYFYDIWSNIHYGYVGMACGFTESELLDGAGLEQIGSDIRHARKPRPSPGVGGLRKWDNASDRESIAIGIRLYPSAPTVSGILSIVEKTTGLSKKPLRK